MNWVVDSRDLIADARAWLGERIPNYRPDPAGVTDQMIETGAMIAQEILDVLGSDILPGIESALLERDGFLRQQATSARGTFAVVADTVGPHTLKAGESVRAGGVDWVLSEDLTVAPAATTATVAVTAIEPGAEPNGITTTPAVTNSTVSWIDTATLTLTQTGAPEWTVDEHLEKGRKLRRISSAQLILPQDFADFIEIFVTSVARGCTYDGYNPADSSTGNERMVAVSAIDAQGEWVGSTVAAIAQAAMAAQRESSFKVNMVAPTYTTANSAFSFTTLPGYLPSEVKPRAEAAVRAAMSPANHGLPRTNDEPAWRRVAYLYRRELETVAQLVDGVDLITAFTLNGGTSDVALPGAFPLPRAGTVVGTAA